jgi:soluble lytic murein transglycosylase
MGTAPASDSADHRVREAMRRVDALAELGRRDDMVVEVERLRKALSGQGPAEYALAESLTERGHTLTAIGMGWELYRRAGQWNPRLLRIVYPFPFRGIVMAEARERGLDPYLVAGLIRRESAFNPTVTSGAGAMGLMQVMPETGRALAGEAAVRPFDTGLLMQPDINVHLGTLYLATMLDRFDHDLPLVLSAYNAGPTRAARWRDLPEARDPELFTERVPYGETRDYIRAVVMHRALYRALYPGLPGAAAR